MSLEEVIDLEKIFDELAESYGGTVTEEKVFLAQKKKMEGIPCKGIYEGLYFSMTYEIDGVSNEQELIISIGEKEEQTDLEQRYRTTITVGESEEGYIVMDLELPEDHQVRNGCITLIQREGSLNKVVREIVREKDVDELDYTGIATKQELKQMIDCLSGLHQQRETIAYLEQ